jgi:hypothetical protein
MEVAAVDILTLELFDVTVSQALTEMNRALEQHPDMPVRVFLEGEEMVLHNLLRFLERQERKVVSTPIGTQWQLDIAPLRILKVAPALHPLPAAVVSTTPARPLVLLKSAFAPGDRALGRRLLLGLLKAVEPPIPWVGLAHEALELLDDPLALEVLQALQAKGIPIRVSRESLTFMRRAPGGFEVLEDSEWQGLATRGGATIL